MEKVNRCYFQYSDGSAAIRGGSISYTDITGTGSDTGSTSLSTSTSHHHKITEPESRS